MLQEHNTGEYRKNAWFRSFGSKLQSLPKVYLYKGEFVLKYFRKKGLHTKKGNQNFEENTVIQTFFDH